MTVRQVYTSKQRHTNSQSHYTRSKHTSMTDSWVEALVLKILTALHKAATLLDRLECSWSPEIGASWSIQGLLKAEGIPLKYPWRLLLFFLTPSVVRQLQSVYHNAGQPRVSSHEQGEEKWRVIWQLWWVRDIPVASAQLAVSPVTDVKRPKQLMGIAKIHTKHYEILNIHYNAGPNKIVK